MSGAIFSYFLSIVATGTAIKLMDDYLDEPTNTDGQVIYALLALSVGASLNPEAALSLFLAAYASGMISDLGRPLPLGLKGWQESLLVLSWGCYRFGWVQQLGALAIIMGIQLYDDLADYPWDRIQGYPNFVTLWGYNEVILSLAILLLTAATIDPQKTLASLLALPWALQLASWERRTCS
ncbi:MAG: hypothetical protein ACOYD6_05250 [Limnochordia bacterium]